MSSGRYSNRRVLQKVVKHKLTIISANVPLQKTMDQAYPFKQDNNFYHLTGIDEPSLVLVMYGEEEFLILPKLSKYQEKFDGVYDKKDLDKKSGIHQILESKEGWDKVAKLIKNESAVATLIPSTILTKQYGIYPNPARKLLISRLKRLKPKVKLFDSSFALAGMRRVKSYPELIIIQEAIDITTATLKEALDPANLRSLKTAKELEAFIGTGFISRGADGMAFDPIIAQGEKATTIHYTKNDQTLNNSDLLLIDVGCEYKHYCSDISRTVSLGKPTIRQQAVFDAVNEVQQQLISIVKAGLTMGELEDTTVELIGKQLIKLGLIKKPTKEAIRRYYPHSVSHSLGLDVHDLAYFYKSAELLKDSVITIEPGIYIPEESIAVRIEDDVLVKEDGCEVLSRALPTRLC